jgi:hypothetical protein
LPITQGAAMSNLLFDVIDLAGHTMAKVVPVTIMLAITFTVLTHFCSCNPGKPWWLKRELVTEICYWFFVPVFARVVRIGLLVLGAAVLFNIHEADDLIAFYDNGHGPLSQLPLWLQALLFLIASDFVLLWVGPFTTFHSAFVHANLNWCRPRSAGNWPIPFAINASVREEP